MTRQLPAEPRSAGETTAKELARRIDPDATPRLATWAGRFLLFALFLDLAGTKWASYLPTPVSGLYLPDAVLMGAALLASVALVSGYRVQRLGTAALASIGAVAYVIYRVADVFGGPSPSALLWVRDMAPFLYVALLTPLVVAAQAIPFSTLLRTVRLATAFMAVTIGGRLGGLITPIDIGSEFPLFAPRPDADAAVLGIGILAFGDWGSSGRPRRWVQALLLLLVATNYSRAGLIAASVCVVIAAARERRELLSGWVAGTALILMGGVGLLALMWPGVVLAPLGSAEAVIRLASSDLESGTTGARVNAWEALVAYTLRQGEVVLGSGPATQPVMASGAVTYLSGAADVRAPHNWFVGAFAYHGLVGILAWTLAFARVLLPRSLHGSRLLPSAGIVAYLTASLFGVIVESPFGSLPIVVMAAWVLAHEPPRNILAPYDRDPATTSR